jgi:hypothetical protein
MNQPFCCVCSPVARDYTDEHHHDHVRYRQKPLPHGGSALPPNPSVVQMTRSSSCELGSAERTKRDELEAWALTKESIPTKNRWKEMIPIPMWVLLQSPRPPLGVMQLRL